MSEFVFHQDFRLTRLSDVYSFASENITDDRGTISVFDIKKLNFSICRYFLLNLKEKKIRGKHAHKLTNQIVSILSGSVILILNDGFNSIEMKLNLQSNKSFYIPRGIFVTIFPLMDSLLMVLCDYKYDELEYIRDYSIFVKEKNKL